MSFADSLPLAGTGGNREAGASRCYPRPVFASWPGIARELYAPVPALVERLKHELVAALADEACIVHATPGGEIAGLTKQLERWGMRVTCP